LGEIDEEASKLTRLNPVLVLKDLLDHCQALLDIKEAALRLRCRLGDSDNYAIRNA
jgi:hypothetical protein